MEISVVENDVLLVKSDVLVTAINDSGLWRGGIDAAIQRVAGTQFHMQIASQMRLKPDAQVVIATKRHIHSGEFRDVIFVFDESNNSRYDIVLRGLRAADLHGYHVVTLAAFRLGVMRKTTPSPDTELDDFARALVDFAEEAQVVRHVIAVFDGYEELADQLCARLGVTLS